jgi:hypothetical protein
MSKHLLRELLGLNKRSIESTNITQDTSSKTKSAKIYRTDKDSDVIVKIPSHMEISSLPSLSNNTYKLNNTYNDDLSDVSTPLLYKTLNTKFKNNEKEVEFFSTDKNKMVKMPASNKLRIIKDLSELSTSTSTIPIPEKISSQESNTNTYSNTIDSDIYSDIDLDKYNDNSSILSNDVSNKSSYNSDKDTSYDSFFDIIKSYKSSSTPSSTPSSSNSEYNIFKSSHRK